MGSTKPDKKSFQKLFPGIPTNKYKKMKKGYLEEISGIIISIAR